MKSLVVFDTQFGNTGKLARVIGTALGGFWSGTGDVD